jgi:hypothetical protein
MLSLDKKALKQVNKILRGFLWVGRADAKGGRCHVNWANVCQPLWYRGLGIPDLERRAISLRVCWLWRMRADPLRLTDVPDNLIWWWSTDGQYGYWSC